MVELADIGRQTQAPTPVRIKSVSIEGFRSLRCIQNLALPPLAVLIGANGAGKSTLLRFFDMLGWMLKDRRLQEFVLRQGGGDDQFFMGARQTPRIRAELTIGRLVLPIYLPDSAASHLPLLAAFLDEEPR